MSEEKKVDPIESTTPNTNPAPAPVTPEAPAPVGTPAPAVENTTPPEIDESDLKERVDGANKEIGPILAKFELGLGYMPKITQDGRIAADPVFVSARGREKTIKQQTKPDETITNPDS